MKTRWLVTTILVPLLFLPAMAGAVGIDVAVGGWAQSPEGYVSYKPLAIADHLDLEQDARYDDENRLAARVRIDMPAIIPNIYLMATPMEFEGNGAKSANFNFGDQEFKASVPFYSKVKLDHYDVGLFYGLPLLKGATLNTLNLDLGIDARLIDFEARVDQPTKGLAESTSETFVLPMVFAAVQITPVKALAIEAEGRGISYSGNHYYDFIGRLRFNIAGPLFIAGGYRYEDLSIDEKDIRAEVKIKGPFAEAGFSF